MSFAEDLEEYGDDVPNRLYGLYEDMLSSGRAPRHAAAGCVYLYHSHGSSLWASIDEKTKRSVADRYNTTTASLRNYEREYGRRALLILKKARYQNCGMCGEETKQVDSEFGTKIRCPMHGFLTYI